MLLATTKDLFHPPAGDCEFLYRSHCFTNIVGDTTTSCYVWGGDTAKIEYWYFDQNSNQIWFDTTFFCQPAGEVNFKLEY